MAREARRRRRLGRAERVELWRRWTAGERLAAIAATLQVAPGGVWGEIRRCGGIAPAAARRRPDALTGRERALLERWQVGQPAGLSRREAARRLGRAPSTIAREIQRNGARTATSRAYRAAVAEERAWQRARRPKPSRLAQHPRLAALVARQLARAWSPRQISQWLRMTFPGDPTLQLAPETIYRSLYVQARGVLAQALTAHLRRGRSTRRSRGRTPTARPGAILDGVSIRERPAAVETRAVPGHWEGDLLMGTARSCLVTLVERASRFVVLVRVPSKETVPVVDALIDAVHRLPPGLRRSLTWDRGAELAQHQRFTMATDVQVYFCDPRSPWQRGSNENTNGLLRQFFPKGQDLSAVPQAELDRVALLLNTRPRQTLGWLTPAVALSRLMRGVALTG